MPLIIFFSVCHIKYVPMVTTAYTLARYLYPSFLGYMDPWHSYFNMTWVYIWYSLVNDSVMPHMEHEVWILCGDIIKHIREMFLPSCITCHSEKKNQWAFYEMNTHCCLCLLVWVYTLDFTLDDK